MHRRELRALVTGASGGIGQALAARLCAGGAHLLLSGRQPLALESLARSHPGQITTVEADLRTAAGRDAVLAAAHRLGGLNCLINAAGVNHFSLLEQQDDDAIGGLIELNLTATIQLSARLLPLLQQADKALVVNIGSTFGSIGYPGYAAYCASKFGLRGFSQALRRELADTRVKVLYVAPRATRTAMNSTPAMEMNAALSVTMDEPDAVAAAIVRAIGAERQESYLGWPEKFFVRLNSLLPHAVDRALRKQLPDVKRFVRGRS